MYTKSNSRLLQSKLATKSRLYAFFLYYNADNFFFYSLPLCVQIYLIFYWFSPSTVILFTSYVEADVQREY